MGGFLDWLTGRERVRQEADEASKQAPDRARKPQEHPLAFPGREAAAKEREAPQQAENGPRAAERLMPKHAERLREMHDNPPAPQKPEQEREATRMEYTRTAQPAPSMGGGSGVQWVNSRVQQQPKDWADQLLEDAKAKLAAEPEQERDRGGRKSIWADDMREAERQAGIERGREHEQEQALERELSRPMERERGGRTRWN